LFHGELIHGNILYSEKAVEKKPGLFSIQVKKATVLKNWFRQNIINKAEDQDA